MNRTLLGLLPLAVLCLLWLLRTRQPRGWGEGILDGLLLWSTLIVALTEGLSLFGLLRLGWVALLWSLLAFVLLVILVWPRQRTKSHIPCKRLSLGIAQKRWIASILAIASFTLLIALVAPPNTLDSLTYHMSRVAHWAQNGSVMHYPTSISRQLFQPPLAEFAILQFQLLMGGDRFANLVQWISMMGCLAAVYCIASKLGADRKSQLFAVVYTATIPMGILQSTSTQTDYMGALWLACFVYFMLLDLQTRHLQYIAKAGLALGLAVLTKSLAYLYALPFLIWYFFAHTRQDPRKSLMRIVIIGGVVMVLNLGHYYRNWTWFGSPLGPKWVVDVTRNGRFGIDVTLSNMVRNATLHLGTSTDILPLNTAVEKAVSKLHQLAGLDVNEASTTAYRSYAVSPISTHEDISGNLLHFILGTISFVLVLCHPRMRRQQALVTYMSMIALGFIIFCSYLKWQPWHARLHLPLFVLAAPVVGIIVSWTVRDGYLNLLAYGLLVFSLPWVLSNNSRPLFPVAPFSNKPSILKSDRDIQYFANLPHLADQYFESGQILQKLSCRTIGLISGEYDLEYPLWVVLKKGKENFTILHSDITLIASQNQTRKDICALIYLGAGQKEKIDRSRTVDVYEWKSLVIVHNQY